MKILQQIIELDKAAAKSTKAAIKEENRKLDEKEHHADERKNAVIAKNRDAAHSSRVQQEQQLADKMEQTETALKEQTDRLDDIFRENSEGWQAEIISRITGA